MAFTNRREAPVSDLALLLSPHLPEAATEIDQRIRERIPRYARRPDSRHAQRMRQTILSTAERFVAVAARHQGTARPRGAAQGTARSQGSAGRSQDVAWRSAAGPSRREFGHDDLLGLYADLGAYEARAGRTLDELQTAIWTGGRVACKRITLDAYRFGWPQPILASLIDELFVFLDAINGAAAQAFADTLGHLATAQERHRGRLRDLLVAEPPPDQETIARLAAAARWETPGTIGVVALRPESGERHPPLLPPMILARWEGPDPYLVVPDPDGPGRHTLLRAVARCGAAALGPTVPLAQGAKSRNWARRTLDLMRRDVIPGDRLVSARDNVPTLVAALSGDLIENTLARLLGPLLALPERRRDPLIRTLDAHLGCGENTALTAERLGIHHRTVRARLKRLEELYHGTVCPPGQRLDLMLTLHWYLRSRPYSPSDPNARPGAEPHPRTL